MDVVVSVEQRFLRAADGTVWTQTQFAHTFWQRYLSVFDHVRVVARVKEVSAPPPGWQRSDAPGASFAAVPYYLGPQEYLLKKRAIDRATRGAVGRHDAIILRLPSQIASCIIPHLRGDRHPYGAEVVADPYDVFGPQSISHPLRPFLRWWFPQNLRAQCKQANAVAYVTANALQRRYPPAAGAFATHYSSVELPTEAFTAQARRHTRTASAPRLITVGSLEHRHKGVDTIIDAVQQCAQDGCALQLIVVGDGRYRHELEAQVAGAGLSDRVCFRGALTAGAAVRAELDAADLFVLPSRHEGLPRAMIEAMARGLPCLGSTVGGIPELLPAQDLVPPNDAAALAQKIRAVVGDAAVMDQMSLRNLSTARAYHNDQLQRRRVAFYREVREQTERWLRPASRLTPAGP